MTMNKIIADCEQLAHAVAPELADRPLYVLTADELPWLSMPETCGGFALPHGATTGVREVLGARWRGPGPTIVLAVKEPPLMFQTMLHEISHILPPQKTFTTADLSPPFAAFQCRMLVNNLADPHEPPMDAEDNPHDLGFIRRTLHAYFRASAFGYDVPLYDLFRHSYFHIAQEPHWLCTLLTELQAMRSCSFAKIESTEPPADFMALWQQSVLFYQSFQPKG